MDDTVLTQRLKRPDLTQGASNVSETPVPGTGREEEELNSSRVVGEVLRDYGRVDWDDATRERLETALNESDVVGIQLDPAGAYVDVLLHVVALPESGPLAKDGRRIMRLTRPADLRFMLRRDPVGDRAATQPAIPLADVAAVEDFFGSLAWGGSIYGWRFFDEPGLISDWPADQSLQTLIRTEDGAHSFYWFNECGVERDGETGAFCIEGTVTFDDLAVFDAEELEIPVEEFIADGIRQWDALFANDDRLSVEAQRESRNRAPKWRKWAEGAESAMGPL